MCFSDRNLLMRKIFYERWTFPLPHAMVHFAIEAGMKNIVERTRSLRTRAHTAVMRLFEADWDQPGCPRCHSYDYGNANVHEVPATQRGGCYYRGSKPRACEGIKVVNQNDVQEMFDENEKLQKENLERC